MGNGGKKMAPAVGFEPTTKWLTATYSTAELCRSVVSSIIAWYALIYCTSEKMQMLFRIFFVFFEIASSHSIQPHKTTEKQQRCGK